MNNGYEGGRQTDRQMEDCHNSLFWVHIKMLFALIIKSTQLNINFLISQPKHMLWALKKNRLNETVLLSTQNFYI